MINTGETTSQGEKTTISSANTKCFTLAETSTAMHDSFNSRRNFVKNSFGALGLIGLPSLLQTRTNESAKQKKLFV